MDGGVCPPFDLHQVCLVYEKDLATVLALKASELQKPFLGKRAEDVEADEIKKELADVIIQTLLFVNKYDLEDTDVRPNLKNARVPILFVHGTADPTVPFEMGQEMYELCPTEKDCLFTEGIVHVESIYRVREEYESKLDEFIEHYTEKGEEK